MTEQKVANSGAMIVGLVAFAIPLLLAAIVLPLIGRVYLAIFEPAVPDPHAIWTNATVHIVEALPALILSWTMFGVSRVLVEYAHGRHLSLRASRSLMWVGLGALVALLLNVAVVPVTVAALRGSSLWTALDADVFDIGLLMFAASIVTIGGALEAAARDLQNEHDQIV
ncbi:MAG: hypothetical protein K8S25_09215 [Alphaproteobacteria bacterium]|nr:hypothetical protein [Alphaproteobacteria bacterium]